MAVDAATLLPLLRDAADRAVAEGKNLRVVKAAGPQRSGVAILKGTVLAVLEPGIPPAEEVSILTDALRRLDLSGFFLPPAVREALDAAND